MQDLKVKYAPRCLDDIVGQPTIRQLRALAMEPRPSCWLLEGEAGTGKSATAQAMAWQLGVRPFPEHTFSGLMIVEASELTVDAARDLFGPASPTRYTPGGSGWWTIILEELEWLSAQTQRFLKTRLDVNNPESILRRRVIVLATSNGAGGLDRALLERFCILPFACGMPFAEACQERLAEVWAREAGSQVDLPDGWIQWGWMVGEDNTPRFSMRKALDRMGAALEEVCV